MHVAGDTCSGIESRQSRRPHSVDRFEEGRHGDSEESERRSGHEAAGVSR